MMIMIRLIYSNCIRDSDNNNDNSNAAADDDSDNSNFIRDNNNLTIIFL